MKAIIQTLACVALVLLSCSAFLQHSYTQALDMDVKGIFIGGTYTKAQVEAKWGIPTKYRSNESEFGINETYHYTNNLFRFSDNGIFVEFYIYTPNFPVLTAFRGGIKVGDQLAKVRGLNLGNLVRRDNRTYHLYVDGIDDPIVIFTLPDDRIIEISYTASI
jgi:hypothetical protein